MGAIEAVSLQSVCTSFRNFILLSACTCRYVSLKTFRFSAPRSPKKKMKTATLATSLHPTVFAYQCEFVDLLIPARQINVHNTIKSI